MKLINAPDSEGRTELIRVCATRPEDEARRLLPLLLASGSELIARDHRQRTALHVAVERGFTALALDLIEAGADPNLRCGDGWTPFERLPEDARQTARTRLLG